MNPEWRSRYEIAITAAQEAGKHALRYFDNNVTVEWKKDRSPVTVADREAETLLRTTLQTALPPAGFLDGWDQRGDVPRRNAVLDHQFAGGSRRADDQLVR